MSPMQLQEIAAADVATGTEWLSTALLLPAGLRYEEWAKLGKTLATMEAGVNWWVGDWLNYGDAQYGEKYTQAIDATGRRLQSLMNMASVAGRIPPEARKPGLSWSCHRAVAYVDPADRDRLLEQAEQGEWGSREMEEAVREMKRRVEPAQSTRSGEISPPQEEEPDNLPAQEDSEPEPVEDRPTPEPTPTMTAVDDELLAELERADKENRELAAEVDELNRALGASDLGAEVRKLREKYARLEGRVQQLMTTENELKREAKYAKGRLKKIRDLLGVERDSEIEPTLMALVQRRAA